MVRISRAVGFGLVMLAVLTVSAAAQEIADFQVVLYDEAGKPLILDDAVGVRADDIVIDVKNLLEAPPDYPSDPREVEKGDYRLYGPGDAHYGSITIRSRVGKNSKELYQWWLDTSKGQNIRKSISVICLKRDGSPARQFNFLDCFPTAFAPGEGDGSISPYDVLRCSIGDVELLAPEKPDSPPARWNVVVEVEDPDGTAESDNGWTEWAGGESGVLNERGLNAAKYHTTTPGHKYIDTITLRGPLTSGRKALCQWITETVQGKPWKRTVTVKEITKDGGAGKTFTFLDCFPTRYVFPSLNKEKNSTGNTMEEVAIKPIRLELK